MDNFIRSLELRSTDGLDMVCRTRDGVDNKCGLLLRHTHQNKPTGHPLIQSSTLYEVMKGQYDHRYSALKLVDCRFAYEFEGGHITTAVNCKSWDDLDSILFNDSLSESTLVVLYCEFSLYRVSRL